MSSEPTNPERTAGGPNRLHRLMGALIVLVIVLTVVTVAYAFYKRSRPAGPKGTTLLLPLINKGEAPLQAVETSTAAPVALLPSAAPTELALTNPTAAPTGATPGTSPTAPGPINTPGQSVQTPTRTLRPRTTSTQGPSPTSSQTPTQTGTAQPGGAPSSTPTTGGPPAPITYRNDKGCVDTRLKMIYVFGELVNSSSQAYDITKITLRVYDASGEIPISSLSYDMPNNYSAYANSSIPFLVRGRVGRTQFTRYDLQIDTQPAEHTLRTDLQVFDTTITQEAGSTNISGSWSYTNVDQPPSFVSIVGTVYDADGRVVNMDYLYINNPSVIDPLEPVGQHNFDNLYLADRPCGQGNIVVSILGE